MRASRSWPRSSVPKGWLQDGPSRWALKSMSLIGTGKSSGRNATPSTINAKMAALATASLCRQNLCHVPCRRVEARSVSLALTSAGLAIGDARVEPAIENVGSQVEQDHQAGDYERHRHDHRRVVGEDRADQQRSDPRDAKDLLGNNRAAEHGGHLQRHQRHNRDKSVA